MVEFVDGSLKAQLGDPDMRVPIQYAITEPGRAPGATERTDLAGRSLTFEAPDLDAFPCLALGFVAGRRGGVVPAALNAADEVAVQAVLDGDRGFLGIHEVVAEVVADTPDLVPRGIGDVLDADADARRRAVAAIRRRGSPAG
jgi:1-deoxy-D-xylulose-5-phosphate reductoisomerase